MDGSAAAVIEAPRMENVLPQDLRDFPVHMVGIGGSGMCGLAALLLRRGARVSGTDARDGEELRRLAASGASIGTHQTADSVPAAVKMLVKSAAVRDDHPELIEARRRGVCVVKYAQLLGMLMAHCGEGIAISGTHGKSTTTAWLSYVLRRAGRDPSFVIGAGVGQLGGGSGVGDGPYFVAEACEYDRSFLNLRPRRAAILNIEEDHLDYYADINDIVAAFRDFAAGIPEDGLLVTNADDPRCRAVADGRRGRVELFGRGADAEWRAIDVTREDGTYAFVACHGSKRLSRIVLTIPGRHNIDNALAVIALAHDCGLEWEAIAPPLADFCGAQRRLELRGEAGGVRILDDYAHHPTEIRATLLAARECYRPRELWCVFQPHQHSRTRFLMDHFAQSFSQADHVIVPDIYFVRDSQRDRELVCAADLAEQIRARGAAAEYLPDFGEIVERVAKDVQPGDAVLTMGAGNIWMVADELLARLRSDLPG
jgi:UDP-N-acetylmuramate--alanine ligase